MGSLGELWFDLGIKDNTDEDMKKVLSKLSKEEIKLNLGIDDASLKDVFKNLGNSSKEALEAGRKLNEALGESVKKNDELDKSNKEQATSAMQILYNTERVLRAKERLFQLERSITRNGLDTADSMASVYQWIAKTKKELSSINLSDKASVVEGTGANLTHEINNRKALIALTKQQIVDARTKEVQEAKASTADIANTEKKMRAKFKLLDIEEGIYKASLEGAKGMDVVLAKIKAQKEIIDSINTQDKSHVTHATGAIFAKNVKAINDEIKAIKAKEQADNNTTRNELINGDKIERGLLKIQAIRNRIANDPFRNQAGYAKVFADLDKMESKLKAVAGASRFKVGRATGVDLTRDIQQVETLISKQDKYFRDASQQTSVIGRGWSQLGNQIKGALSIYAVQRFTKQLIEMGGEFEKQHYALRAIVGDLGKADQIFNQLRKVATKSPFHFGDFTEYAKQLAAFSIPINEIYDTTKRLSDVSAGLGVGMDRIILAYGQIRSAGFLRGQEVRQLTEAGIPIIDELANKIGDLKGEVISANQVFDAISRREVPFAMVEQVFKDMTEEGGKFHNMQEKLAESLAGKWSNVTSHFQMMLYDMSQSSRGVLDGMLDGITMLLKNYHLVTSAVVGLTSTYIAFKTVTGLLSISQMSLFRNIILVKQALTSTAGVAGIAVAILGGLATAISMSSAESKKQAEELGTLISNHEKVTESINEHMNKLINLAKTEDKSSKASVERTKVLRDLEHIEPKIANEIRAHADSLQFLIDKTKQYNALRDTSVNLDMALLAEGSKGSSIDSRLKKALEIENKISILKSNMQADIAKTELAIKNNDEDFFLRIVYSKEKIDKASKILESTDDFIEKHRKLNDVLVEFESYPRISSLFKNYSSEYDTLIKELEVSNKEVDKAMNEFIYTIDSSLQAIGFNKGTTEYNNNLTSALVWSQEISAEMKEKILEALIIEPTGDNADVKVLDSWQDYIDKLLDGLYKIETGKSQIDVTSDIKKQLDEAKKYIESTDIKSVEATVARNEDKGAVLAGKEVVKIYNQQQEAVVKYTEALKMLGTVPKQTKKEANEDPLAKQMEDRIKLINDAINVYEKYIPILGEVKALESVQSDARFKVLDFNPNKVEEDLKTIYATLGNTDKQKKVKDDLDKMFTDIDFSKIKSSMEIVGQAIDDFIKNNSDRWNLFDTLFSQTGNRSLSMNLAFGSEDMSGVDSLIDSLSTKLKELTGESDITSILEFDEAKMKSLYGKPIIDLINEIKEQKIKANDEITISDAKAMAETMTLQERANAIRESYNKKIADTTNLDAKDSYVKLMNDELSELYMSAIELSPVWQKLFGDTSNFTYDMVKRLVAETKELLATATEIKDNDGKGTGNFQLSSKDGEQYTVTGKAITKMLDGIRKQEEHLASVNPFVGLIDAWNEFSNADNADDKAKALVKMAKSVKDVTAYLGEVAGGMSDMFDSLGNEGMSSVMGIGAELMNVAGNVASAFAQGGPIGGGMALLASIPGIIGNIGKRHDAKLDKKIQKSALEVKKLQNAYQNVGKEIERSLGAMTRKQTEDQINSLKKQQKEVESMRLNELDKKKTDAGKVADYEQQIVDLKDKIQYFYEDLADSLYSINFKDWSSQLATSMVDAWRSGEDAALAYQKTANDILASVANKMMAEAILEPTFKKLREQMPNLLSDGKLSTKDVSIIAKELAELGLKWKESSNMLDMLNEAVKEASGGQFDLKGDSDIASNLGKGIQENITEDTGQILASYLNAIRQDSSVKRELLTTLVDKFNSGFFPDIALALNLFKKIEYNTLRSANGVDSINDKLESVINGTKKFYTE